MLVEIVETFKKLSDGSLLHPGDVIDIPQEKANRLIERGRARLLPSGTHGEAHSCPDSGSGEPHLPGGDETPLPARFKAGDRVRFASKRALDALEGVVLESKWHPAPVSRWWLRIETGGSKIWTSETHVQAAPGGSGLSNKGGGQ